jgi:hypothetical protein
VLHRALEDLDRVGVALLAVRRPAQLPPGALGVLPTGEPLDDLCKHRERSLVVVHQDVVRGEIVERVLAPRAVGEIGDQLPRPRLVLAVAPESAQRRQVEVPRLGPARRFVEIRRQPVDRRAILLLEVVALGQAEVDQFARIARRQALDRRKLLARRPVGACRKQLLAARQVELEHLGNPRGIELHARVVHDRAHVTDTLARRMLVVEPARQRRCGIALARRHRHPRGVGQHLVARPRADVQRVLQCAQRVAGPPLRLVHQRRLHRHVLRQGRALCQAAGLVVGVERLVVPCEAREGAAAMEPRVRRERRGGQGGRVDQAQRRGRVAVIDGLCRLSQLRPCRGHRSFRVGHDPRRRGGGRYRQVRRGRDEGRRGSRAGAASGRLGGQPTHRDDREAHPRRQPRAAMQPRGRCAW